MSQVNSLNVEVLCDYSDTDALLKRIRNRIGHYEYKKTITYDATFCAYHHHEETACSLCTDICPTFGLVSDETRKELIFSALDCIACGRNVWVCAPRKGAIDFAPFPQEHFWRSRTLPRKENFTDGRGVFENIGGMWTSKRLYSLCSRNRPISFVASFKSTVWKEWSYGTFTHHTLVRQHKALKTLNEESLRTCHQKAIELVQSKEAFEAHMTLTCKSDAVCQKEIENRQRIQHGWKH